MAAKYLDPVEWRNQPDNIRLDRLTKLFIMRCTTKKLFTPKGMCGDYFKIRNYFRTRPDDELAMIYDFIYPLTEKMIIDFKEVYRLAEIHRKKLIWEAQKKSENVEIKSYTDITIDDILNM